MSKTVIFTVKAVNMVVIGSGDSKRIGEMVRFHRKLAGLSQEELALYARLGKTVIFDIEKGKTTVRLDTLLRVLKVLNISMDFQGPVMNLFQEKLNAAS